MGRRRAVCRVLGPYSRADGRFALVLKGPGVQGGTDQQWFFFTDNAEALKAKREMEAGLKARLELTVVEAVEQYLDHLQATGREQSTVKEARARLNPLIRLAPKHLSQVQPAHIQERLDGLKAVASQRATLARMNDFFNFSVIIEPLSVGVVGRDLQAQKRKKPPRNGGLQVELRGLEPLTSRVRF